MNDIIAYITLGVVQGLTEFLPVSSTGHLIVAREILGISVEYGLAVDATLHLATALAVALYFRRDILRLARSLVLWTTKGEIEKKERVLILALILGTLPAVFFGFLYQGAIETTFRFPELVAYALLGGSALMFASERIYARRRQSEHRMSALTAGKGFLIGFFQALALIPGVSRSGATISGGLLFGLTREEAARFAFLLSFPVILGAGLLKLFELGSVGALAQEGGTIAVSALGAFLSGLAAIHFMMRFLKTNTLDVFIVYRLLLAGGILVFL